MKARSLLILVAFLVITACGPPPQDSGQQGTFESAQTVSWLGDLEEQIDLSEEPLRQNIYVVLDDSGSMEERSCQGTEMKYLDARTALERFVQGVPSDYNVGLLIFNGGTFTKVSLGNGTANREAFFEALSNTRADGGTPLHSAVKAGFEELQKEGRRQLGYGEYHLVVVTDGEANFSENPSRVVDQILSTSPVVIHTIGFCIGGGHSLNQPGRILYKEASNLEELQEGLDSVLAESEEFIPSSFEVVGR